MSGRFGRGGGRSPGGRGGRGGRGRGGGGRFQRDEGPPAEVMGASPLLIELLSFSFEKMDFLACSGNWKLSLEFLIFVFLLLFLSCSLMTLMI